jgi:predicted N-formylglutamate amidohydrolase
MAAPILEHLQSDDAISVGDNKPYRIDRNDYGVPVHGEGRGLPHVLIEIRQDLIASEQGQQAWASLLADLLNKALDTVR